MDRRFCLCLVAVALLGCPAVVARQEKKPMRPPEGIKIGLVDDSRYQYLDGCGCAFWPGEKQPKFNDPASHKYVLVGNYDKQAWMNIDGKIVQFELVKNTAKYKGKVGDRYFQSYQSGDITVNVECVATGFGDTHAVFCDATITVIKGAQKRVVKAVGSCGC